MNQPQVVVIDRDSKQGRKYCEFLEKINYSALLITSIDALEEYIHQHPAGIVIIDLDTVEVDKRVLRKLKREISDVPIIGFSNRPFHPELTEVIGQEIDVCISKPIDEEELLFWLKSLLDK